MSRKNWPVLGLLLLGLALPAVAQKKPKTPNPQPPNSQPAAPDADFAKAKALFERGEAFFKLGEYEKALVEYREAYLVSKAPLLLLNIGQCYRHMGEYEEARHNYEAFLREDPKSPYLKDVEEKIVEMEAILEAKRKEADQTPASLVVTVKGPTDESKKLKPWILGAGIGAVILGGSALTFFLLRDALPAANGGNAEIKF